MKKFILALMGLMMVGAMAMPAAAQGRDWNRDNQTNSRRDYNRRNDFGFSRRNRDQRDNRYDRERRSWDQYDMGRGSWGRYDNYDRNDRWQRQQRERFRFNERSFRNRWHR
jgi:hypothetical protein